jgi:hypothetical protein
MRRVPYAYIAFTVFAIAVAVVTVRFAIGAWDGVRVETKTLEQPALVGNGSSFNEVRAIFGDPSEIIDCGNGIYGYVWTDGATWQAVLCSPGVTP